MEGDKPEWWDLVREFFADHPEYDSPVYQWINYRGELEFRGDCCHAWHCWLALKGIITPEAAAEANRRLLTVTPER